MAVLAIAAFERGKNARVIFSRQFLPMSKSRIDSLLQAFPRLLSNASEHTFIETDSVRYVYQSNTETMVVMITNRLSALVQDLETLRLVQRVLAEECGGLDKQSLSDNVFDAIVALDEVVNAGYQEQISYDQIKTYLVMDSHEEYLHNLRQQAKISEAKQKARAKEAEIAKNRQLQQLNASAPSTTQMQSYSSSQFQQQDSQFSSYSSDTSSGATSFSSSAFSSSSPEYRSNETKSTTTETIQSKPTTATSSSRKLTFTSSQPTFTNPSGAQPGIAGTSAVAGSSSLGNTTRKPRGFKGSQSLGKKTIPSKGATFEARLE